MKRYILLPLLAVVFVAQAQDTYMNERLTNNSSDVIGTARYVGMGGALGALGADMSVISWNPAGIGLYRKNDIALTFGGTWGKSSIAEENRGTGTFDQAGFVYNMKIDSETCPYVNFSFNFQKKINFNQNFYASNGNLGGLSQMDQLSQLTKVYIDWKDLPYNLVGHTLLNNGGGFFFDETDFSNQFRSTRNAYTHHSEGSLQAFDFNLSTNISNRAFLGLTVGVDNMRYRGWNNYSETGGDYGLHDYGINLHGTGVNVKLGAIVRPFADSPFRIGFAVETPTWYRLTRTSYFYFYDDKISTPEDKSCFDFNIRSPWKVRASIGSTVGSFLAWDVDYEYGAYAGTSMGYPDVYYNDGTTSGNNKDVDMNQQTRDNMRGTHTLRTGIEVKPIKALAFRMGYNLSTSAYNKNISFDQYNLDSKAMNYATSTSYMRMGTTNIITLGMGYQIKNFYIDLAYKIRSQTADFYAFDTNFTSTDPIFRNYNPGLADRTIDPVNVDLTRHAITCTLGFKF